MSQNYSISFYDLHRRSGGFQGSILARTQLLYLVNDISYMAYIEIYFTWNLSTISAFVSLFLVVGHLHFELVSYCVKIGIATIYYFFITFIYNHLNALFYKLKFVPFSIRKNQIIVPQINVISLPRAKGKKRDGKDWEYITPSHITLVR